MRRGERVSSRAVSLIPESRTKDPSTAFGRLRSLTPLRMTNLGVRPLPQPHFVQDDNSAHKEPHSLFPPAQLSFILISCRVPIQICGC